MNRTIMHIDLDYFYAQLEELRKPELKGKPVVVCMFSGRTQDSGAVATANYKAREFGVHAGMPIAFAKRKAPNAVFLPADREHYSEVSSRIMDLLREFSEKFEQVGIDEAYVDVTRQSGGSFPEARKIAEGAKKKILEEEKVTCSVGIGPNKLIAKMASSVKKPDGLTVIAPAQVTDFLRSKRISDLHGVGEKTAELLKEKGISNIPQLAQANVAELQGLFGENRGRIIREKALGMDNSEVEEREKQQYSRIATLKENTSDCEKVFSESKALARDLAEKALKNRVSFKTVSIILISDKLETVTRSKTLEAATQEEHKIIDIARELFTEFFAAQKGFVARRFGLRISNFEEPRKQKSLFDF
ncbi:MAG: DNA polymerase IV [archaeon]